MSGVVTVSRALTPRNWTSTSDPTNGWDAADGVRVGDHWYNTTSGNVFVCVDNTTGAAKWRHIPRVLASGAPGTAHTGTVNETGLVTVDIPANALGANGRLRVSQLWSMTNNANNKTFRIRWSTISGTAFAAVVNASVIGWKDTREIANRGATNSQAAQLASTAGANTLGGTPTTGTIDTTAATTLLLTAQLANSGDSMTLESYSVELLRPDIT